MLAVTDGTRRALRSATATGAPGSRTPTRGTPSHGRRGDRAASWRSASPRACSAAIDLAAGRGRSLADDPATAARRRAARRTAWPTAGRRRTACAACSRPPGGVLGAAGVLLDRPGLRGAALALTPGGRRREGHRPQRAHAGRDKARARLRARRCGQRPRRRAGLPRRANAGLGRAPASLAAGLDRLQGRPIAGAGRRGLRPPDLAATAAARRDGDHPASARRGAGAPTLTVVRPGARRALPRARRCARLPASARPPELRRGASTASSSSRPAPRDRRRARPKAASLAGHRCRSGRPGDARTAVTSLVFLDFSQLLRARRADRPERLRAYLRGAGRPQKVRAVGAARRRQGNESTAELTPQIP